MFGSYVSKYFYNRFDKTNCMGIFKRAYRKLFYVEELKRILKEEEELIKEWRSEWINVTSRIDQVGTTSWGGQFAAQENIFIKEIWDDISALSVELRKLEEIGKLLIRGEEELPKEERKVIRQLRRKLDWDPLKEKKQIESLISFEEHRKDGIWTGEKFDKKKYQELLNQVIGSEIEFWKHLFEELEKIRPKIEEEKKTIEKLKRIAEKFLARIAANDPNWWDHLGDYFDTRKYQNYIRRSWESHKEIFSSSPNREKLYNDLKGTFKESLEDIVLKCAHILKFFKRADILLNDIEIRLKKIRP